jgi:hemerythrin-like metal-binding protein
MEKFVWSDEYSVGVELLDNQHKRLFGIINKLIEGPEPTADVNLISQILTEMLDYAKIHFKDEEELMRKYRFAGLEAQETQHTYFVKTTEELSKSVINDKQKAAGEVAGFLRLWLTTHILKWDMKYKELSKTKIPA